MKGCLSFRSNNRGVQIFFFQSKARWDKKKKKKSPNKRTATNLCLSLSGLTLFVFFSLSLSFLKSNRSDSGSGGGNISRRRLRVSLEGNPFCPGAPSFNRMYQQKVRSTMSKLATMASRAGFDVAQSGRHILWRFCRLPLSSLWELIKHWTAWGRASAPREGGGRKKKILLCNHPDWLDCTRKTMLWQHRNKQEALLSFFNSN